MAIAPEKGTRSTYNLIDRPWIPCATQNGDPPCLLSLREVFNEANRLEGVADASPAVTISLYRLLLAILHRSLEGPSNTDEWQRIWNQRQWDLHRINHYLDTWHARFDLFDEAHPFYQTPGIPQELAKPATQLTHERASERNRPLLFDHSQAEDMLTAAEAARYLLVQQNFAVGGLTSYVPGELRENRYVSGSPLLNGAVVLVRGETLFATLMLNAVQYSLEGEKPFPFNGEDQPSWEHVGHTQPVERLPNGYVDLLTWQSRRILLFPRTLHNSEIRVSDVALMKGYQFAESFEQWTKETMMAFRASKNSRTGPAYFPIGLKIDRVVWRDSQSLLQSQTESSRPQTMNWLATLMGERRLEKRKIVPLEIYGLIPDQANILDWRRESLPLPLRFLEQDDQVTRKLLERLAEGLSLAETISRFFDVTRIVWNAGNDDKQKEEKERSTMWVLCEALLAGLTARVPKREDCSVLARRFGTTTSYWSRLDAPFRRFVEKLADYDKLNDLTVEDGVTVYGMGAFRWWAYEIEVVASSIFEEVQRDLDTSARTLRASSLARQRFNYHGAIVLSRYRIRPRREETQPVSSTASGHIASPSGGISL